MYFPIEPRRTLVTGIALELVLVMTIHTDLLHVRCHLVTGMARDTAESGMLLYRGTGSICQRNAVRVHCSIAEVS
jgi:hypothetical protein